MIYSRIPNRNSPDFLLIIIRLKSSLVIHYPTSLTHPCMLHRYLLVSVVALFYVVTIDVYYLRRWSMTSFIWSHSAYQWRKVWKNPSYMIRPSACVVCAFKEYESRRPGKSDCTGLSNHQQENDLNHKATIDKSNRISNCSNLQSFSYLYSLFSNDS